MTISLARLVKVRFRVSMTIPFFPVPADTTASPGFLFLLSTAPASGTKPSLATSFCPAALENKGDEFCRLALRLPVRVHVQRPGDRILLGNGRFAEAGTPFTVSALTVLSR